MKQRQYKTEPPKPAAHRGVAEQITDGLRAIPRGIGRTPAGIVDFFGRAWAMAKNPQAAALKEMERPGGWKDIFIDFLGVIFVLIICLGISIILGNLGNSKFDLARDGPVVPFVALIIALQVAPSLLLIMLLTVALLHIMARLGGSRGQFERMAGLVVMLWAVVIPLTVVVGLAFGLLRLPSLAINGRAFYSAGEFVMDAYLVYMLARLMTAAYQMPFGRALFMTVIYQVLVRALMFMALQSMPAGAI